MVCVLLLLERCVVGVLWLNQLETTWGDNLTLPLLDKINTNPFISGGTTPQFELLRWVPRRDSCPFS